MMSMHAAAAQLRVKWLWFIWGILFAACVSPIILLRQDLWQLISGLAVPPILQQESVYSGLTELSIRIEVYQVLHIARHLVPPLLFVVLGILVFWRKPGEWITLLYSLIMIGFGILLLLDIVPALDQTETWIAFLANLIFISFFASFYLFPDGRFYPRWTRWMAVLWLYLLLAVSIFAGTSLDPNTWPPVVSAPTYIVSFLSCPYALFLRYRRSMNNTQRMQTKWVLFGISQLIIAFLVFFTPINLSELFLTDVKVIALYDLVGGTILMASYGLMAISFGFALLRYRLWDIDPIINRTMVSGLMTAAIIVLYVGTVSVLGLVFQSGRNQVFGLIATGLVAILFNPLRDRLQQLANRMLYGYREDPYEALSNLGKRLEKTRTPEAILPEIVNLVRDALKVPYVSIRLSHPADALVFDTGKSLPDRTLGVPIYHLQDKIGELVLGFRGPDEDFNPADRRLLADLARQAGVAAQSVRLNEDLKLARRHLVHAREEERRRLRRDLHDGLGPHMASQMLTIRAAQNLIGVDPDTACRLLDEAITHAHKAIEDIRRVVNDLRPPVLDDLGLVGALQSQARDDGAGRLRVRIETPGGLPPLPAAVEAACYRTALEALTNVVRHAEATECLVRLTINGSLKLEVSDNGRGLPANLIPGVGLNSMRARAEELGGCFMITRVNGSGTLLVSELPLGERYGKPSS